MIKKGERKLVVDLEWVQNQISCVNAIEQEKSVCLKQVQLLQN